MLRKILSRSSWGIKLDRRWIWIRIRDACHWNSFPHWAARYCAREKTCQRNLKPRRSKSWARDLHKSFCTDLLLESWLCPLIIFNLYATRASEHVAMDPNEENTVRDYSRIIWSTVKNIFADKSKHLKGRSCRLLSVSFLFGAPGISQPCKQVRLHSWERVRPSHFFAEHQRRP